MYCLTLLIMLFYMFIALTAEITAIGKLIMLLAPVPLWITAAIVLGCTLIYTSYARLRASIFTDKVQMLIIVPLLIVLIVLGWEARGGLDPVLIGLRAKAPQLLRIRTPVGIQPGRSVFVASLLAVPL